jgi:hypothetical protein
MTASLHITPSRATSSNGLNLDGAKWYFYQTGTTTPQSVYTTAALSTPHPNPVVADAAGKFANIYFDASLTYRGVLKSSDDATTIYDIDPINTDVFSSLAASGGSALIGFLQAGTGVVARTAQAKMRDFVSVKDFGATGDGIADDTAAIQAAIETNKSLYFPAGVYLVDELNVPAAARGAVYRGAGFYHYSDTYQTVIKARTLNQDAIFTLANGADCVTFEQMRLDGDLKALKVIDGTFGAFLAVDQCGIYEGVNYGFYSKQGLARITRCFMAGSTINCHLYSDSSVSDSEFTQNATSDTEICILLAAGGNRLVNVWANSSTVACVKLQPFDGSTNHINTDIVNLYAGEVFGGAVSKPIIHIEGTVSNTVQQVRIANAFIVCAQANVDHINDGIYCQYAKDVELCNFNMRGIGSTATATLRMNYGINATNTENLNIVGGTFRDLNKNPIKIGTGCSNINVVGSTFIDWALDSGAAGDDFAAVLSSVGMVNCTGCTFTITTAATGPFAAKVANATDLQFLGAVINYPGTTIVTATTGTQAWHYKRSGVAFNYMQNHAFTTCGIDNYLLTYNQVAAGTVPNGSIFWDSATGKLSFKDAGGVTNALY